MKYKDTIYRTMFLLTCYEGLMLINCDEIYNSSVILGNHEVFYLTMPVGIIKTFKSSNTSFESQDIHWYSLVKMVQELSHNMSTCYNQNTSNVILQYSSRYQIEKIEFYNNQTVLYFHTLSDDPLFLSCPVSSLPNIGYYTTPKEETLVVSVLHHVGWREIVLMYDSKSVAIANSVTWVLSNEGVLFTTYNIDSYNETELSLIMKHLHEDVMDGTLNITMICHIQPCLAVLKSSNNFQDTYIQDQMRIQHISKWIIFSNSEFDQKDLNSLHIDNILFMNVLSPHKEEYMPEANCYKTLYVLRTLMWTSTGRGWSQIGIINSSGDSKFQETIYPNAEYGLNGRMIRATTIEWGTYTIIEGDGNYTGLCFDILNEIAQRLNFTYEILLTPDDAFGSELPNGSWTGMVGMIEKGHADLVASSLTINGKRESVLDFTYPFVFDYTSVVYAKPSVSKWRTLLDPYSNLVLLLIGVSLFVVSVIFFLVERWHPKYDNISGRRSLTSIYHTFWYMYGALLAQGGKNLPTSQAGRTIISSWWIFCIIAIAVYSGNLTATLAISKQKLPFTTVAEMVKQTDYKWGTLGNSVYETVFKESAVPSYIAVWRGIVEFNKSDPTVLSISTEEHYKKVAEGNYAFIIGRIESIDYETANNCDLIVLDEQISPNYLAFAMSNNSPFVRIVSDAMLSLHESGFIAKWVTDRWPERKCDETQSFNIDGISLEEIQSSFYLIAIGFVCSCIVLSIEKMLFTCHNYKSTKRQLPNDQVEKQA